jgi:4-hydroxy-tetrahydrodipicolinate synthase
MAGTGSNSTEEAIDLTSYAKKTGADAALVITPYYNKPTAKGQMEHYKMIAKEVDIPIVLYNVPSRTGISISPEVVAELSKIDNIVAIKEASGSLKQVNNILSISDITVLSGDDFLTLPILSVGGQGVVSVTSNIMPQEVSNMVNSYLQGNIEKARNLHFKMYPVFKGMFIETNPICVKTAMKMMNMLNGQLRMPLSSMEKENEEELKKILIDAGLIRR